MYVLHVVTIVFFVQQLIYFLVDRGLLDAQHRLLLDCFDSLTSTPRNVLRLDVTQISSSISTTVYLSILFITNREQWN
jgi:hypothetical protein